MPTTSGDQQNIVPLVAGTRTGWEQVFLGNGRLKQDNEYVRYLERELEIVRQERDVLIKVVGIFLQEPKE